MNNVIAKVNWVKVAKVASAVVSGVLAFTSAISEQRTAAKLTDLETRLSNLESK